jgi:hypothetical protein
VAHFDRSSVVKMGLEFANECAIAIFMGYAHGCDPRAAVCAVLIPEQAIPVCAVTGFISDAIRAEACKGKNYGSWSPNTSSQALEIR